MPPALDPRPNSIGVITSMNNRRNYYRLLHVQPDAPLAVIKASYCALMLKLKQHPDLGGNHENAALINEAYATLSRSCKRRAYDDDLRSRYRVAGFGSPPFHWHTDNRPFRPPQHPRDQSSTSSHCLFCHTPYQGSPLPGSRCVQCGSPLCPPIPVRNEGRDQRAIQRFEHGGHIAVRQPNTIKSTHAVIQDLSPTGMGLMMEEPLTINQVVKIDSALLSAVARVVSCRPQKPPTPARQMIGVEFLTLEFAEAQGTFVSSRI